MILHLTSLPGVLGGWGFRLLLDAPVSWGVPGAGSRLPVRTAGRRGRAGGDASGGGWGQLPPAWSGPGLGMAIPGVYWRFRNGAAAAPARPRVRCLTYRTARLGPMSWQSRAPYLVSSGQTHLGFEGARGALISASAGVGGDYAAPGGG